MLRACVRSLPPSVATGAALFQAQQLQCVNTAGLNH